jgi:hypothetical protein
MKKNILTLFITGTSLLFTGCMSSSSALSSWGGQQQTVSTTPTGASQNYGGLGSGLEKLLGSLLGNTTLSQKDIIGTWRYSSADCVFESENFLMKAGGEVAAAKVEEKINATLTKLGLTGEQITFTFNADNTYTASIKGRVIQGTYALDVANKKLTLTYLNGLGTITPQIAKTGNKMSLLYDADKLLKFLTTISAVSNNSTLKSLSTLLESYDGMLIGWELQK